MTILTVKDVSARLQVCTETVYRLTRRKKIKHIKVGGSIRITEQDLEEYLEKQRNK